MWVLFLPPFSGALGTRATHQIVTTRWQSMTIAGGSMGALGTQGWHFGAEEAHPIAEEQQAFPPSWLPCPKICWGGLL